MEHTVKTAPTIETDGWTLISALARHEANPGSFDLPSQTSREQLRPGDAAKLLFDLESKENGEVFDRGVDRMWVIVRGRTKVGYEGVLDNNPGTADNVQLREGDTILFGPEHIVAIDQPPREYILDKYGLDFFSDKGATA